MVVGVSRICPAQDSFSILFFYLLVSTTSFTLSILQCKRPAAINRESSLEKRKKVKHVWREWVTVNTFKDVTTDDLYALVDELRADSEGLGHVAQREGTVRLQELAVGQDPHLTHIVTVVRGEEPVLLHFLLHTSCSGTNSMKQIHTWKKIRPHSLLESQTSLEERERERLTQRLEEDGVTALVEGEQVLTNSRQTVQHLQNLCTFNHLNEDRHLNVHLSPPRLMFRNKTRILIFKFSIMRSDEVNLRTEDFLDFVYSCCNASESTSWTFHNNRFNRYEEKV